MGWDFAEYKDKNELIRELNQDSGTYCKVKSALKGNHLWQIEERVETGEKIIVLYLLSKQGRYYGYKDMTESMGPYYYTCPISFLREVPVANAEWREKVVEFHRQKTERRRQKIEIGAIYTVNGYPNLTCQIIMKRGRSYLCEITGKTYRIGKNQLGEKVQGFGTTLA